MTKQSGIARLLKGYDVNGPLICNILKFGSPVTGRNRMKDPGNLTINEYVAICRSQHIPAEEARAALRFN